MRTEITKLKSTSKYPTSIIVRGLDYIGIELANSLIEQGGYVVMIDSQTEEGLNRLDEIKDPNLFTFLDFTALPHLEDDLRRLDYVFFFNHNSADLDMEISTQEFLEISNYLNAVLDLSTKFEAKFLLTTSIKAHRRIVSHQDVLLNFSPENAKKHSVYSEVEVQRYSESLTMEYAEKAGLNTRIVRMGEIIGEGIEFKEQSDLTRLAFDAVQGNDLEVYGDGLEEEYYVNGQDAIYGLLKAEFSQDTKGKIFTIANEDSITALSLAYKIQELEARAGEIRFVDKKLDPYLRLYKPASNLSSIGWKPKVTFERSVAQTLELAYDFLRLKNTVEFQPVADGENPNFADKLKDFFFVAKDMEETIPEGDQEYGALSRLIAERKRQESTRRGSIVLANDKLRARVKDQVPTPFFKKVNNSLYKFFNKLKPDVAWVKKLTLDQFLLYLFLLIIGGFLYFGVLSPVLSFGKDTYLGYKDLASASQSFKESDQDATLDYVNSAKEHFNLAEKTLSGFEQVFTIANQQTFFESIVNIIRSSRLYSEGLSSSISAVDPMYKYFNSFDDKVFYRPNSADTLVVEAGSDYSTYFDDMKSRQEELANGINKTEAAISLLQNTKVDFLPSAIRDSISSSVADAQSIKNDLDNLNGFFEYVPEVFGANGPKTYLILLNDNTRYSPSGGHLNSYALITLKDGSIKHLEVNEITKANLDLSTLDAKTISQINLVSFSPVIAQSATISDVELISDHGQFDEAITALFEKKLNQNVDGVISMDLTALQEFVDEYGDVNVDQFTFTGDNFSDNLKSIASDTQKSTQREQILNQVFAISLQKILTESKPEVSKVSKVISDSTSTKNMILDFKGMKFQKFVSENNWNASSETDSDFVKIYAVSRRTEFNESQFPILNVSVETTIASDLTSTKKLNITTKNMEALDYVVFCIPAGSTKLDFGSVNPLLYNQNFDSNNECASVKFNQFDELKVTYTSPAFENNKGTVYNYNPVLQNNPGLEIIYDEKIIFDPALKLAQYSEGGFVDSNSVIYAGNKKGDLVLYLQFEKNE
jgi:nucleoside-diphosphate-sugar epimerase